MSRQKVIVRMVACIALCMACMGVAHAQYTYKFSDELGTYKVVFTPADKATQFTNPVAKPLNPKTHELRLGITWGGTNDWCSPAFTNDLGTVNGALLPQNSAWGPQHWYSGTIDYGYWITEWCSIGGTATWTAGVRNIYNSNTQKRPLTLRKDYIAVMPIARFAWYRNGCVQLYSSFGIGLGIERYLRYWDGIESLYSAYCTFDIKPLGIAVGRKWFGFAEVGYGSRGIVNVGVGHRFNSKTK